MLCTLVRLEFVVSENVDNCEDESAVHLDDEEDDEEEEANDELEAPEACRGNIFGPGVRIGVLGWVVTGEVGVECEMSDGAVVLCGPVSSIK
jgi:hypothetical protein